jgi:hypothetical protein
MVMPQMVDMAHVMVPVPVPGLDYMAWACLSDLGPSHRRCAMAHTSYCLACKNLGKMAVAAVGNPEADGSRADSKAVSEAEDSAGIGVDLTIAALEEAFVVCCSRVDLDSPPRP